MDQFIEEAIKRFYAHDSLDFIVFNASPDGQFKTLKESLHELKASKPNIKYILMGTRRTDGVYFANMTEMVLILNK